MLMLIVLMSGRYPSQGIQVQILLFVFIHLLFKLLENYDFT